MKKCVITILLIMAGLFLIATVFCLVMVGVEAHIHHSLRADEVFKYQIPGIICLGCVFICTRTAGLIGGF